MTIFIVEKNLVASSYGCHALAASAYTVCTIKAIVRKHSFIRKTGLLRCSAARLSVCRVVLQIPLAPHARPDADILRGSYEENVPVEFQLYQECASWQIGYG